MFSYLFSLKPLSSCRGKMMTILLINIPKKWTENIIILYLHTYTERSRKLEDTFMFYCQTTAYKRWSLNLIFRIFSKQVSALAEFWEKVTLEGARSLQLKGLSASNTQCSIWQTSTLIQSLKMGTSSHLFPMILGEKFDSCPQKCWIVSRMTICPQTFKVQD